MSSELTFEQQMLIAVTGAIVGAAKTPDDAIAQRAIKITNAVINEFLAADQDDGVSASTGSSNG